jgi:hypothetical protein
MDRVFPKCVQFGNVILAINLYDEENDTGTADVVALYETIFRENPIVKDVRLARILRERRTALSVSSRR